MTSQDFRVTVIGGGVSGLTCAVLLQEAWFPVTLVAKALPPHTTSSSAGAIWYPYKAYPEDRVLGWSKASADYFYTLMSNPSTGVSETTLVELLRTPQPDPWWKDAVRSFGRASADELPSGYVDGFKIKVPLIEAPRYLQYLMNRFEENDGTLEEREIEDISSLYDDNHLIINCTGLGARSLVGDEDLHPMRGQIMRVTGVELDQAFLENAEDQSPTYIIPRQKDIVLGGTATENDENMKIDLQLADDIWRRATAIKPEIKDSTVIGAMVGLRPARSQVRLELEEIHDTCAVIHNYGHGGAGFTLSWGCAEEVLELANNFVQRQV